VIFGGQILESTILNRYGLKALILFKMKIHKTHSYNHQVKQVLDIYHLPLTSFLMTVKLKVRLGSDTN
jgi:hypothetical protein